MDGYQLKGVGPNPLVGDHDRIWHSYGGLNARDAVYETMMSEVLRAVLPVGAAKVYGVILTTSDGAYYEGDGASSAWTRGWGAILVREICLRPGHFFRVPDYAPRRGASVRIPPDTVRVREINHALRAAFPKVEDLIQRLGGFLQNCAHQFAFARLGRITHGGIGPSNLCFDGRWIDLTNTSFIGGGENVGGLPPVYEEPFAVRPMIAEFIDTFSKYNGLELNAAPLIKYYDEELDAYFAHYLPLLFGMEPVEAFSESPGCRALLAQVTLVLNSGRTVVNRWPVTLSSDDPVVRLQRGLILSPFDRRAALAELSPLTRMAPGFSPETTVAHFQALAHAAYEAVGNECSDFCDFMRLSAVEALRRSFYSEYFFKGRLVRRIKTLLDGDPFSCRALIDESIALAEWVFKRREGGVSHLFRSEDVSIAFDARAGVFTITSARTGREVVERDPEAVLEAVNRLPAQDFLVQDYDFRAPLTSLVNVLKLTRAPSQSSARIRHCEVFG